jgi:hypothetical protein
MVLMKLSLKVPSCWRRVIAMSVTMQAVRFQSKAKSEDEAKT